MECDPIYCFDRASVLFAVYPEGSGGPRVVGEISEDALRDVFGAQGGGDSLVEACQRHGDVIEEAALRHFRRTPNAPVRLTTHDFSWVAPMTLDGS
jgi:hypothetical protein